MSNDKSPCRLANDSHLEEPDAILESISDGVFTINGNWLITSFNRAAEEITGITRNEAIGSLCSEVFKSSMCESECALRQTLANGRPIIGKSGYIIDAGGNRIPISVSTAVLKTSDGIVIGGAETFRDLSEVEALRRELKNRFRIGDIISNSPSMCHIFDLLPAVADSSSTVLVQGETGTGKELLAKAIHQLSPRNKNPFIAVNCGALPDTLLEAELFGYKKGAFTGANHDKPGRFALAGEGTLFLDEIGEVSPSLQVRLLRVLQDQTYDPLGATKTERSKARIIVATHRNLKEMIRRGEFRQDLYYRINIVSMVLPPLRQRKEDIPLLVNHFVDKFNNLQGKSILGLTTGAHSLLMSHQWPGNIRELENVIERAFILCEGKYITPDHLPEDIIGIKTIDGGGWRRTRKSSQGQIENQDLSEKQEQAEAYPDHNHELSMASIKMIAEEQSILNALRNNDYNRLAAARELGIHKTTLHRKIRLLKIKLPPGQDGRRKRSDSD